jgi:hypothetical protein
MSTTRLVQLGAPVVEESWDVVSAALDDDVSEPEVVSDEEDDVVTEVLVDDVDGPSPAVSDESVVPEADSSLAPPPHAHSANAIRSRRALIARLRA